METSFITKINEQIKKSESLLDKISSISLLPIGLIERYKIGILSFLFTFMFYFPSYIDFGIHATQLYVADVMGYYFPALMKTHALLSSHIFSGIDYSLFNGSSEFFLSANFFAVHPFIVLYSLLLPFKYCTLTTTTLFLITLFAVHSYLACYFTLKLLTRFFKFEMLIALFAAVGFTFSVYTIHSFLEPPFLFCSAVVPWMIYGALCCMKDPSLKQVVFSSFPIVCTILGGYIPLGLGCFLFAAVVTSLYILVLKEDTVSLQNKIQLLLQASFPFVLALIVSGLYLWAAKEFHLTTISNGEEGIYFSAHQLSELPQTIIRLLSQSYVLEGPFYENTVIWEIIPILTILAFFFGMKSNSISAYNWILIKIAASIYFLTVLAIYGPYSPISSMVYYYVPYIGRMHIYQRFLFPASLLFMMMTGLMLGAIAEMKPLKVLKVLLFLMLSATVGCALILNFDQKAAYHYGINNNLMFELILGCLFIGLLLTPGKKYILFTATFLMMQPSLNKMYSFSYDHFQYTEGKHKIPLNNEIPLATDRHWQEVFISYLDRFKNKEIIKYADLTPYMRKQGIESFPKDFPYFILRDKNLSSYFGFTFYLSSRTDYMNKMPFEPTTITLQPDINYLKATRPDFILVTGPVAAIKGPLAELIKNVPASDRLELPNNIFAVPLTNLNKHDSNKELFDNGYFRVTAQDPSATFNLIKFHSNKANHIRFTYESNVPTTMHYLFFASPRLIFLLNGKVLPVTPKDGLVSFDAPPGKNALEVKFRNKKLSLFWIIYAAYFASLIFFLIPDSIRKYMYKRK